MKKPVKLGEKYRDTISGFEGIATARYEFVYGCVRVNLEGPHKDGAATEMVVDEQRLEGVAITARSGGPTGPIVARPADPTR